MLSQNLDLIVTIKGDSIACKIDSIAKSNIYFEFILNHRWISTSIKLDEVADHKFDAVNNETVHFKSGTSYIEYKRQQTEEPRQLKAIQRNSIYLQGYFFMYGLNYDHLFPISEHLGILLGVDFIGIFYDKVYSPSFVNARGSIVMGGPKNFFEVSFLYPSSQFVDIGYRYQSKKGFLLRLGAIWLVSEDNFIVRPGISLGYSF